MTSVVYSAPMEKNFEKIVMDLRAAGYNDVQIAEKAGCSKQYIGKIGRGEIGRVGFQIGIKLAELHEALS